MPVLRFAKQIVRGPLNLITFQQKLRLVGTSHCLKYSSKEKMSENHFLEEAKRKYGDLAKESIFTKILEKQIPAKLIHEDNKCVAFHDVSPQGPVHFLVIPRLPIPRLQDVKEDDKDLLGHLMFVANKVAGEQGLHKEGYRVVVNNGEHGCQSVGHLHLHVIGGRQMQWPPG